MKIYCSECGTPHEYASKKPNFCTNCGYSFAGLSNAQTTQFNKKIENQEDFEENESAFNSPDIDQLQVEVEPYQNSGVKIEDVVDYSTASKDSLPPLEKPVKGKRLTKKAQQEFLDDWKKEAGTNRKKNS